MLITYGEKSKQAGCENEQKMGYKLRSMNDRRIRLGEDTYLASNGRPRFQHSVATSNPGKTICFLGKFLLRMDAIEIKIGYIALNA